MSSYDEHLISMAGGDGIEDAAYTEAVQAAVSGRGDWAAVQVAGRAARLAQKARGLS